PHSRRGVTISLFPRPCSLAGLLRPLSSRRQRRIRDHFASEFQPDWVSPQVSCGCARPGTTQRALEKDNDNDTEIIPSDRPDIDCKRRETHDGSTRTSPRSGSAKETAAATTCAQQRRASGPPPTARTRDPDRPTRSQL